MTEVRQRAAAGELGAIGQNLLSGPSVGRWRHADRGATGGGSAARADSPAPDGAIVKAIALAEWQTSRRSGQRCSTEGAAGTTPRVSRRRRALVASCSTS